MAAHLRKCAPDRLGGKGRLPSQVLLLRVQASGPPMYWLDLAAPATAKLKYVDMRLRHVWLECCSHLSEFYRGRYDEVSMNARIGDVLGGAQSRLGYVYDFGSSTELTVSRSAVIEAPSPKGVQIVARNEAPVWPCDVCEQPATAVCTECIYEDRGFLCPAHASEHECGEEMLLPVVNSPRMGVCAYTGEP